MYKVKAFQGLGDNPPIQFIHDGLNFQQATFTQEELISFLDNLLTHHTKPVTLSIRLENFKQLGAVDVDVILEVTGE